MITIYFFLVEIIGLIEKNEIYVWKGWIFIFIDLTLLKTFEYCKILNWDIKLSKCKSSPWKWLMNFSSCFFEKVLTFMMIFLKNVDFHDEKATIFGFLSKIMMKKVTIFWWKFAKRSEISAFYTLKCPNKNLTIKKFHNLKMQTAKFYWIFVLNFCLSHSNTAKLESPLLKLFCNNPI